MKQLHLQPSYRRHSPILRVMWLLHVKVCKCIIIGSNFQTSIFNSLSIYIFQMYVKIIFQMKIFI